MPPIPPDESLGALLARARSDSGKSQLRIAELLCAASGQPTVTRHEVSRWEREERIPSDYWLRWLAAVFEIPLGELERAAALARDRRAPTPADPPTRGAAIPDLPCPPDVRDRIGPLRRMEDLVGGADLYGIVDRELRRALGRLRDERSESGQRELFPFVAELAQLAGWVAADAGQPAAAARAHRVGLRAATAVGDDPFAGHLLAALAHLSTHEDPRRALALARGGQVRAGRRATAGTRSLLLHRVAFAAARAGDRPACESALAGAERLYDRRDPTHDPSWTYWFNELELAAMTGRCYAALGRPRLAEPLLRSSLDSGRIRLRPWALYAAWLATAHLDAGEVERACTAARRALLAAIRVGSVRALRQVVALHPRLLAARNLPAVREYAELWRTARPYLPGRALSVHPLSVHPESVRPKPIRAGPDRTPLADLGADPPYLAGCG